MKFLNNIDLNGNEIQNILIHKLATAPTAVEGKTYYDTVFHAGYIYNGTAWRPMDAAKLTDGSIANSALATNPLARANHTGTQASSTISDLATVVKAYRIDEFANPTADRPMNGYKITGLADPVSAQDAATKNYVDNVAIGLDVKNSVRAASTATVGTYGSTGGASGRGQLTACPTTLDGVTLVINDRVLIKDHSTPAANGIYVVTTVGTGADGVWNRATDFDADADVSAGAFTFVEEGTANADSGWTLTTNNPIVVGGASGTSLAFAQFSGAGQVTAGAGLTKTGNTIDIVGTASRIIVNADSIDIHASYVGQASITTLGTITTGTWNATVVTGQYGGTGVANTGKTITLGGNLTTSGAYQVTFTLTASTTVTLPTSGTLVSSVTTANGVSASNTAGALSFTLGAITPTTVNGLTFAAAANGFTIAGGTSSKTLTQLKTMSFTAADDTGVYTFPTGTKTLVATDVTTLSSLVSIGTITTGTWTATVIAGQYGGTGVANTGKTITLGGSFTTSGAFTTTLTVTANTNVTLPTTGTLATLAGAETITGKVSYNGMVITANTGVVTTGTWQATAVAVGYGGTGGNSAATAKTNLGFMTRYSVAIGNGALTSITVTHNLGTRDVVVMVYTTASTYDVVQCDVQITTTNTVTLIFATAPTASQYTCVVIG